MTRSVTLLGYAVLAAAVVACQTLALLHHRIPTIGQTLRFLTNHPVARPVVLAVWLWVGWHTFVRGSFG